MSPALDFAAVFWPAHPVKVPFSRLAIFCVLLAGCQTVPEVAQKPPELPPKGDIAGFVVVQDFLRAVYCPALTEYKVTVDPQYQALPGMTHADFDLALQSGMAMLLKVQGNVYIEIRIDCWPGTKGEPDNPAYFIGVFDRVDGKLRVFQERYARVDQKYSLWIMVNTQNHDQLSLDVEPDSFGRHHGFEVESKMTTKIFQVSAPSTWTD